MKSKTRKQFDIDGKDQETLSELVILTSSPSEAEAIKKSLRMAKLLADKIKEGYVIEIKKGEEIIQLMPVW